MKPRPYHDDEADLLWQLLHDTVHQVNCRDYSSRQLQAWAPDTIDLSKWSERLRRTRPIVVEHRDSLVGFAELEPSGHIDCFYVHVDWQRKGVGGFLLNAVEQSACEQKIASLYTESSITARPFFQSRGFILEKEQTVTLRGSEFINYRMSKQLVC